MINTRTVEVDFAGVTKKQEVHTRLATALGFPDYYGKNWDAFWDCITSLDATPQKIRVSGLRSLMAELPREATLLKKCL